MSRRNKWNKDDCIDSILSIADKIGETPSWKLYHEHKTDEQPSGSTIQDRCGSWSNALELAELKSRPPAHTPINVDYFKNIDTPEKAYWLGLIYADGYVAFTNDTNKFIISLSSKDGYLLEQMLEDFESEHTLQHIEREDTSDMVSVTIAYRPFVAHLNKHGLDQDKTYSDSLPDLESDSLRGAFVRGMFDGDGWVGKYQLKITGSSEKRWKHLGTWLPCKSDIYKSNRKSGNVELYIPSDSQSQFFHFIYSEGIDTSPKLERKFATFRANL